MAVFLTVTQNDRYFCATKINPLKRLAYLIPSMAGKA